MHVHNQIMQKVSSDDDDEDVLPATQLKPPKEIQQQTNKENKDLWVNCIQSSNDCLTPTCA